MDYLFISKHWSSPRKRTFRGNWSYQCDKMGNFLIQADISHFLLCLLMHRSVQRVFFIAIIHKVGCLVMSICMWTLYNYPWYLFVYFTCLPCLGRQLMYPESSCSSCACKWARDPLSLLLCLKKEDNVKSKRCDTRDIHNEYSSSSFHPIIKVDSVITVICWYKTLIEENDEYTDFYMCPEDVLHDHYSNIGVDPWAFTIRYNLCCNLLKDG